MKFIVADEVFEKIPAVCFGVVVAKGIDNTKEYPGINDLLNQGIESSFERYNGKNIKEEAKIIPYRKAFEAVGINPNKYQSSIEALFMRIAKGKGMPHINPVVDLGNAVSLKHVLPIGAHDVTALTDDITVRFSDENDTFIPFGSDSFDNPADRELIYTTGHVIRTRRWIWRQSEIGKITGASSKIFFPIDGFIDFNKSEVLEARDELCGLLKEIFGCEIAAAGFVDADNREMGI